MTACFQHELNLYELKQSLRGHFFQKLFSISLDDLNIQVNYSKRFNIKSITSTMTFDFFPDFRYL